MSNAEAAYAAALEVIRKSPTHIRSELHFSHLPGLEQIPPEIAEHRSMIVLGFENTKITNLEPIAGLSNLTGLGLKNTPVSNLAPIANHTNLEKLHLDGSQVVDLAPIREFRRLKELSLNKTRVTDLGPLAGLVSLDELSLMHTPVADLRPLRNLASLEILRLIGTAVVDLDGLQDLVGLEVLSLGRSKVVDLRPLMRLNTLKILDLNNTPVSDLRPLANLTGIHGLYIGNTKVADIGPIQRFRALSSLNLELTAVADIAPLRDLASLHWLRITNSHIADIGPLSGCTELTMLDLSNTSVDDLRPIKDLPKLIEGSLGYRGNLSFKGCKACDLDPEGLGKLAEIEDDDARTRRTIDYLQSLTDWPPVNSDPIEAAMHGPILEASLADLALVETVFEAVSPDPPLPMERGPNYDDLVEVLAYAADRLARADRADRFGMALIDGFKDYRRRVKQEQPNGRLLNFIADAVRAVLVDDLTADALDGFDRGQIAGFLENHDALMRGWFPAALAPVVPEPDLSAEVLSRELPPMVRDAEAMVEAGIAGGIFGESVRTSLAYLRARMDAALKTLATSDSAERLAVALSDLRRTAVLAAAWVGRIKGRLMQYAERSAEWARENPVAAARNAAFVATGFGAAIAWIEPIFSALWRFVSHLPLPF